VSKKEQRVMTRKIIKAIPAGVVIDGNLLFSLALRRLQSLQVFFDLVPTQLKNIVSDMIYVLRNKLHYGDKEFCEKVRKIVKKVSYYSGSSYRIEDVYANSLESILNFFGTNDEIDIDRFSMSFLSEVASLYSDISYINYYEIELKWLIEELKRLQGS
jgi:hypothetical protein